ncbi:MAG: GWxTD domain-containing protein [Ignavibacterium sp.]|nr:MAG: GWxTD domain-containing protein [Ignavibacterium sp.]
MKRFKIIIVLIFFTGIIYGQQSNTDLYSPGKIKYYQDILNFKDDDGKPQVDLFIQVPFREIQFIRSSNGFEGGYSVTVSIYDEQGENLVLEKVWNEKVSTNSFDEVSAKENFNISHRSFNLEKDTYFIKTTVMDRESKQEFSSERLLTVKDFEADPSLSDILLISSNAVVEGMNKVIPNISRNVSNSEKKISMFFEIYSDSDTEHKIEYVISNKEKEVLTTKTESQAVNKGKTQVYYTFVDSSLGLGTYLLTVTIKDNNNNNLVAATKPFYSRWIGLPSTVNDIDKAIAQVVYIANPDEMDYMKEGKTEQEKTKRFLEFWKSKDPSPGNDENEVFEQYFSRVAFANENFSHYVDGWSTDRGMVFIILGVPSNIERHPFEYNAKPYEIWQYYELNKSFVFTDQTGFGDYRLVTPMYGDLFRYRY